MNTSSAKAASSSINTSLVCFRAKLMSAELAVPEELAKLCAPQVIFVRAEISRALLNPIFQSAKTNNNNNNNTTM